MVFFVWVVVKGMVSLFLFVVKWHEGKHFRFSAALAAAAC